MASDGGSSKSKGGEVMDVRSVVEAISASGDHNVVPLYDDQSLGMRCSENGVTRLLFTLIPHFREILLSTFECTHCGERNNGVQFAGEIHPRGSCYSLEVPSGDLQVLDRQVVKSESATIKVPPFSHSHVLLFFVLLSIFYSLIITFHFPVTLCIPVPVCFVN